MHDFRRDSRSITDRIPFGWCNFSAIKESSYQSVGSFDTSNVQNEGFECATDFRSSSMPRKLTRNDLLLADRWNVTVAIEKISFRRSKHARVRFIRYQIIRIIHSATQSGGMKFNEREYDTNDANYVDDLIDIFHFGQNNGTFIITL